MENESYTKKVSEREGLSRQPVMEVHDVVEVQNSGNHKCKWRKEENQTHPTLTSYVCTQKRCGRGLLIDTKVDSIDNYV